MRASDFLKGIGHSEAGLYFLENKGKVQAGLTNYGARIVSLKVPDDQGIVAEVVLGYNTLQEYMNSDEPYHGAIIGRYSNRISKGSFSLQGKGIQLDINDPPNHLHGGANGFHTKFWDTISYSKEQVTFRYLSSDGEEGYPGNLEVTVTYSLNELGELRIDYSAVTDRDTVINMTNHAYFNLSGSGNESIGDHVLYINADEFTPVNENMIPTGVIRSVENTPFDFRTSKQIKRDWDSRYSQLQIAGGYDHNFILNKENEDQFILAAVVEDPSTGRKLEVLTTEPGMHFYSANAFNGKDRGREGIPYVARCGFCLETQHFPDSANHPHFPEVLLEPGKKFMSSTVYRFSAYR